MRFYTRRHIKAAHGQTPLPENTPESRSTGASVHAAGEQRLDGHGLPAVREKHPVPARQGGVLHVHSEFTAARILSRGSPSFLFIPKLLQQHNSISGTDPVCACFYQRLCRLRCANTAACLYLCTLANGLFHQCHVFHSSTTGRKSG